MHHSQYVKKSLELHIINIRGIITKGDNKSPRLAKLLKSDNPNKIIAITETHLADHFDEEVLHYFPSYSLFRSDRDTTPNPSDPHQLSKMGGAAILTSPGITAIQKETFSNGNCELIIVECPELELTVINFYRPTTTNFSLQKIRRSTEQNHNLPTAKRSEPKKDEYRIHRRLQFTTQNSQLAAHRRRATTILHRKYTRKKGIP